MPGVIVDIDKNQVSFDNIDIHDQIKDTVAYTRTFADSMQLQLEQSIDELRNTVGTYNPDIENVSVNITPLDKPAFPAQPTFSSYSSVIWEELFDKILDGIVNGGNGLSTPVYNAIIEREKEARRSSQDKEYRTALDGVGELGFNLPSGHVASIQTELSREILTRDQDSLNNLAIKDFDLATENTRFSITTGVELENMLRGAWNATEDRKVSTYAANVDAIAKQYAALADWTKAEVDAIQVRATIAIENEKLKLSAYNSMATLAEKVAESIASIAAQSIASSLGAVNTTMSTGYDAGESRRETWGHADKLNESHNFTDE